MSQEGDSSSKKPFPRAEMFFYVVGTVIAAPLGKAGIDAIAAENYFRGALALTGGIVTASVAFSFRFWESHLEEPARKILRDIADHRVIMFASVLIFAGYSMVVIPDLMIRLDRQAGEPKLTDTPDKVKRIEQEKRDLETELSSLRSQLQKARAGLSPTPDRQPSSGPIIWDQNLNWAQSGDANGTFFVRLTVRGTNGPQPTKITEAYLLSGITGERKSLVLDGGYDGLIPLNEANEVPPGAHINLVAPFDPPLRISDFVSKWTKIYFKAEYNDTKSTIVFDEDTIQSMLRIFPDSKIGPRVTRKSSN